MSENPLKRPRRKPAPHTDIPEPQRITASINDEAPVSDLLRSKFGPLGNDLGKVSTEAIGKMRDAFAASADTSDLFQNLRDRLAGVIDQSASSTATLAALRDEPYHLAPSPEDRLHEEVRKLVNIGIASSENTQATARLMQALVTTTEQTQRDAKKSGQRLDNLTTALVTLTTVLVVLTGVALIPVIAQFWTDWVIPFYERVFRFTTGS